MIAALLDEEQLPALRLVSKQTCHHLSDIFASVHFAHLHHHLTKPSLQDLIHITNHAMFSTYIKSIQFSTVCTESPSRWYSDFLLNEGDDFRRYGHHINMLTTALENLKHHGNYKVSLGVFDSLCKNQSSLLRATSKVPTYRAILGHGYVKSYGVSDVPTDADPDGAMFAIRQAATNSEYSLQKFSMTTSVNLFTQARLFVEDNAGLYVDEVSNQFKPNLTIKHVVVDMVPIKGRISIQAPCLTVEVQTSASSHLLLQGRTSELDELPSSTSQIAFRVERFLCDLPLVFTDTRYKKLTLRNLQFNNHGVSWLCSTTKEQAFECLEVSNVDVCIYNDANDLGRSTFTFLNHFKRSGSIEKLKISNFVVDANFYVAHRTSQPLRLATDEIVAEGYNQVQTVFDDLIAQISTWHGMISRI